METIFSLNTTIFAWATPVAPAARAILRVSGPEAFSALNTLFIPDRITGDFRLTPHQTLSGAITIESELKLRAWLWIFPGPKSYTGQDLFELHTLSSPPLGKLIERELLGLGLTAARPGEFSARAFLLGKMDLTQAQAVQQLVAAQNDAQINAALNLLAGSFHQHLDKIYRDLSDLAVALEANIDFSEEQVETITLDRTIQTVDSLRTTLEDILNQAADTRAISSLPRAFLVGIANAGKSTLLNRLTGLERAICSVLPGTTRDILTAVWSNRQKEILLCDTPGLLQNPNNAITRSAIERVGPFLPLADLTLLVLDPTQDLETQLQLFQNQHVNISKILVILNKLDLIDRQDVTQQLIEFERRGAFTGGPGRKNIFPVSARTGEGVAELTGAVFDRLSDISLTTAAHAIALDRRGRELLENTLASLNQAATDAQSLKNNESLLGLEIIAVDIQQALRPLGSLLGKDVTEDVLENIFQNSASENKISPRKISFFLPFCILIFAFCNACPRLGMHFAYASASASPPQSKIQNLKSKIPPATQSQPADPLALLRSIPDNPIAAYVSYTNTGLNPATGQVITSLLTTASLAGLFNANQQILVDIVSSLVTIGKFPHAVFLLEARCKKLAEGSFTLAALTIGTVVHAPPAEHGKLLALLKQTIDHYFTADDARIAWVGTGELRHQKLDSPRFPKWCCWEWGSVGPIFVFTVGPGAYTTVVNTILEKHPSLFNNPLIETSKAVDTDFDYRFMTVYLNLTALSDNLRPVMKDSLDTVIESFGAAGIDQFLYSAGFAQKAYLSKTFVARGDKVSIGYLTGDFPPGDPRARAVPPGAGSYGVGFTDLSKAVSYLVDTYLASRNPIRREKLIANYHKIAAEAGLGNLREFLLAHFGPAAMVVVHDWPKHPFNLPIGKTLIIQHDHAPDFIPTTHKILATWQRMLRAMGETGKQEKFTSAWETLFDLQLDQTPDNIWFLHLGPFVFLAAGLDDNFLVLSYSIPAVQVNLQYLKSAFRPTTTSSAPGP